MMRVKLLLFPLYPIVTVKVTVMPLRPERNLRGQLILTVMMTSGIVLGLLLVMLVMTYQAVTGQDGWERLE